MMNLFYFRNVIELFRMPFGAHFIIYSFFLLLSVSSYSQNAGTLCKGKIIATWTMCSGQSTSADGSHYAGEWQDGKLHGRGLFIYKNGDRYIGEFKYSERSGKGLYLYLSDNKFMNDRFDGFFENDKKSGLGVYTKSNGDFYIGEWIDNKLNGYAYYYGSDQSYSHTAIYKNNILIKSFKIQPVESVNFLNFYAVKSEHSRMLDSADIKPDGSVSQEISVEKKNESHKKSKENPIIPFALKYEVRGGTDSDVFTISFETSTAAKNLVVNGVELGSSVEGKYIYQININSGQSKQLEVVAMDFNGNVVSQKFTVAGHPQKLPIDNYSKLNIDNVRSNKSTNAVAIIIGIENYRNLPRVEFANNDAREIHHYMAKAWGLKPQNIKLMLNESANDVELSNTFNTWLPTRLKNKKTDIYIYFNGYTISNPDGKSFWLLPWNTAQSEFFKTAINFDKAFGFLAKNKQNSVTLIFDRTHIQIPTNEKVIPQSTGKPGMSELSTHATVMSSLNFSPSPVHPGGLNHGFFSYYLMKGMEGDADLNQDGVILNHEMQDFVSEHIKHQSNEHNLNIEVNFSGNRSRLFLKR